MKAAVFLGPKIIEIQEREKPSIKDDELLVKVRVAGICGTDVKIFNGGKKVEVPKIIGHEFSGEVFEVGSRVKNFISGDRVAVEPIIPCGLCYSCKSERFNLCLSRPTIGYEYDGGFAEYVRIPSSAIKAGNVVKLPANVSFEEGALAEPAAACINGNRKLRNRTDETLWIIGDGPIGLIHVQLAKNIGFKKIILSGEDEKKLFLGKEFGASFVINIRKVDAEKSILELTDGNGVDQIIIAVNNIKVVSQALSLLKKGGLLILFAGFSPDPKVTMDLNLIHYREISIIGSSGHSARDLKEVIGLMKNKKLDLMPLISDRLSLEDLSKGINFKEEKKGIKQVIVM